ncbi:cora-domain-containing protein [Dacryopinax primogenitus]|uniref:Magnesium transporter n=1 Tax=Dacryopinax primogenitus (strain DJM 731) TaxID=1858805 RepID=M5G6C3_DACPD|nr:cora-domain-containing protein [Dacryopinax primogenitus]EJT99317.1 cora-domain-containing protein [Dacryopinax primogenitus]
MSYLRPLYTEATSSIQRRLAHLFPLSHPISHSIGRAYLAHHAAETFPSPTSSPSSSSARRTLPLHRSEYDSFSPTPLGDQEAEEAAKASILDVLINRQPTDLQLRCTVLDQEGNIKTISGKFRKADLCVEHRLNPRDLRKIDSRVPNLVPTILSRKDCILVNILHIRALIKCDTVLLFDTYGSVDTRLNSVFLYHLEHNLKLKSSVPYEFRALESVLASVVSALESEMVLTRQLTTGLLTDLEDDIDRDKLKRLLHYSRRLAGFRNRAKLVDVALEEVLEQDEDLAAMYLSDRRRGRPREAADHEELEVLLESFAKQVEEIENEASTMMGNVQSTQEIVELILDSNRNALLALDIKIAILTLGVGVSSVGAAIFGMNLRSALEESSVAFWAVSGSALVAAGVVSALGLGKLARLRRVGLGGGRKKAAAVGAGGRGGRGRWLGPPLRGWGGGKEVRSQ